MKAEFFKHTLQFKRPGGTSRGILHTKETYILEISLGDRKGTGECSLFHGLSYDDVPDYEDKLAWLCKNIGRDLKSLKNELKYYPSIIFGLEQALLNLQFGDDLYFPSEFTDGVEGIRINGLIWMGNADFMQEQIQQKLTDGYRCIKLKIGVDWLSEHAVIKELRKDFPVEKLEIRVDANGAFKPNEAKKVLEDLANLDVHSIEQPIAAGDWESMADICKNPAIPVALDEELIEMVDLEEKEELLNSIKPQYIILKPSLVGGFSGCDEWISLAKKRKIGWWITSALESNIGLNAIAQYTFTKNVTLPQGLGTGGLFTNNFESSLFLEKDMLFYKA